MSYFPIFVNLDNLSCLIIGGGKVALRKAKTLLDYGAKIKVVAPNVLEEFKSLGVAIEYRNFETKDLTNVFLVVTATNDLKLNQQILEICKSKNILCNSSTDNTNNGYIFPSVVKHKDISIGISTSGKSPYISSKIKSEISEILPKYDNVIELSNEWRKTLIEEVSNSAIRGEIIKHLIDYTLSKETPSKENIQQLIKKYR